MHVWFIKFLVMIIKSLSEDIHMKRELVTAVPPEEIQEILEKSKANLYLCIKEGEPFYGAPRWKVVLKGSQEEIEKFMEVFMRARAGG